MVNDVELILQGYEWSMQLFLMIFQNDKNLCAILGHMSNKETFDSFNLKQDIIRWTKNTLMSMLVISYAFVIYFQFSSTLWHIANEIILIKCIVLFTFSSVIGFAMLY